MLDTRCPSLGFKGLNQLLHKACNTLAIGAGLTLLAMALMSLRSIVGRSFFDAPLLGDYELVQILCAAAVSMCLPLTHWTQSHVAVDFFAAHTGPRMTKALNILANSMLAFFSFLLGWRTWLGMIDLKHTGDASMLLNLPTWWAYAPITLSFLLLGCVALFTVFVIPHGLKHDRP